jgi:hypothetical protein
VSVCLIFNVDCSIYLIWTLILTADFSIYLIYVYWFKLLILAVEVELKTGVTGRKGCLLLGTPPRVYREVVLPHSLIFISYRTYEIDDCVSVLYAISDILYVVHYLLFRYQDKIGWSIIYGLPTIRWHSYGH